MDIAQLCWLFCAAKRPEPTLWEGSLEEVEQKLTGRENAGVNCLPHTWHMVGAQDMPGTAF